MGLKPLDAGSVDLWLVSPDEIDETVLARYRALATPAEQAAVSRFHFERHRRSHLVTRAAVRVVLSKYAAIAPQDWRFEVSAHGRPHISREHAGLSDLRFNISHTDGLIACAVTIGREVGVDVEHIGRRLTHDVAGRFFAPREVEDLKKLLLLRHLLRLLDAEGGLHQGARLRPGPAARRLRFHARSPGAAADRIRANARRRRRDLAVHARLADAAPSTRPGRPS